MNSPLKCYQPLGSHTQVPLLITDQIKEQHCQVVSELTENLLCVMEVSICLKSSSYFVQVCWIFFCKAQCIR